jgi:hypothetical protein
LYPEIENFKFFPGRIRYWQRIQLCVIDIYDLVTIKAHEVVVDFDARVVTDGTSRVTRFGNHTHTDESFQGSVNGGA